MAVKGMDTFIRCFAEHRDAFILIGGAACDLWFTDHNLQFRATKDLDVVLIIEHVSPSFTSAFWGFIRDGGYEVRHRSEDGPPVLYRFVKPRRDTFPFMVELFCRDMPQLDTGPDQRVVPVRMDGAQSLSAILLHESYYRFLMDHCRESRGIMAADATALIPLKARAWLDLTARRAEGEEVKEDDIKKHRNDVFRLAATLPGDPTDRLPDELAADVTDFLARHPVDDPGWDAIQQAIRPTVGGILAPTILCTAIRTYFQIGEAEP
jgi:hypothetical protein